MLEGRMRQLTTQNSIFGLSSLDAIVDQGALSAPHKELCSSIKVDSDLWQRFVSSLTVHGCLFKSTSGQLHISTLHSKLVKTVTSAVKVERSLSGIVDKVRSTFRTQCIEKTVKYVLDYLEQESLVYSYIDEKEAKSYHLV